VSHPLHASAPGRLELIEDPPRPAYGVASGAMSVGIPSPQSVSIRRVDPVDHRLGHDCRRRVIDRQYELGDERRVDGERARGQDRPGHRLEGDGRPSTRPTAHA